jgi:hypothetical protein
MKCEYGCDNEAKFKTKHGKNICSKYSTQCPINKLKNSTGLKRCYDNNQLKSIFSTEVGVELRKKSTKSVQHSQVQRFINGDSNTLSNHVIKKLLLRERLIIDECSQCSLAEWRGKKLNLELDHIDGNNFNNNLLNLRLLCPNCHSQTDTYCGKNKNTGKTKVSDKILLDSLIKAPNIRQALINVDLSPKGGNYTRALKLLNKHNIQK